MTRAHWCLVLAFVPATVANCIAHEPGEGVQPGALVCLYDLQDTPQLLPDLVAGQAPNVANVVGTIDLDGAKNDFAPLKENFLTEVTGVINLAQAGPCAFRLVSDDGARLWIDDRLVIDHDGPHGATPKDGTIDLAAGPHTVRILHFQGNGDVRLALLWKPPGAAAGADFVVVPAAALTQHGDVPKTAPGKKRVIAALRRGRPGDGTALAGPHPSFKIGTPPIRPDAELTLWLTNGALRTIGRPSPRVPTPVIAWLPSGEGARTGQFITKLVEAPYHDQIVVWIGGADEARRIVLDRGVQIPQGCAFRFGTTETGLPAYNGTPTFEMLSVQALTNGLEIEFTKPLDPRVGWEADSYYIEQWLFNAAEGVGATRDGVVYPVKSASVSPDRRKVFLEIDGLKPAHVVYLRLLPPCLSEAGELPWSTEAWYTLNALPEGRAGQMLPPPPLPSQNVLTDEEQAAGWKLLFDGQTGKGWHGYKRTGFPAGWKAMDGCLVRAGPAGDISTDQEFDSFELTIEWRISPGGNSGVFYRSSEKYDYPWETGPELQVLDNAEHADGRNPKTSAGSNYALVAPVRDVTQPVGLFNKARIVVKGNHVEHWLNDVKVVEYELGSPQWKLLVAESKFNKMPHYGLETKGHIVLQDHGDKVWYRNIKIRVLDGK